MNSEMKVAGENLHVFSSQATNAQETGKDKTVTSQQYRPRRKIPAIGAAFRQTPPIGAIVRTIEDLSPMEWIEQESAPDQNRPTSSPVAQQPVRGRRAPSEAKRADDLAVEIELIASHLEATGARVTAASVMDELVDRAGGPDSCVTEAMGRVVLWLRGSTGQIEKLDMTLLKRRLYYRRKERKAGSEGYAKAPKGNA